MWWVFQHEDLKNFPVWEWLVLWGCVSVVLCCSCSSVGISYGGPQSTQIIAPSGPSYQFLISCAEFLLLLAFFYTNVHISFKTLQLLAPCDALPSISPVQGRTALTKMKMIMIMIMHGERSQTRDLSLEDPCKICSKNIPVQEQKVPHTIQLSRAYMWWHF